jgi:Arc/MetJ family transcription regulator
MATNLAIDPQLLQRALEIGGERTKRQTVNRALEEFVARRSQKGLLELMGKLEWDSQFDYKKERQRT